MKEWGLHDFRSIESDLFLPLAFLCTIWPRGWGCKQLHDLIPSTFLDFCWSLVDELGFIGDANSSSSLIVKWRGGDLFFFVYKRYASRLDGRGRNLIGTCMTAHIQWLRDVILQPWLFMVSRDIVGSPPMIDVYWHKDACHAVTTSHHLGPCYRCASRYLRRWWKQAYTS